MRRQTPTRPVAAQARVRRGYFECRYGQLHVHNSIPPGGGLEAAAPQYPLRERLARLSQRLLVLRPHDDLWEATGRVRDVLPAARLLELEPSGQELFASAAAGAADTVREFLQG